MLLKAWVAMGELSVRMVVPMAMKKLPWSVSECIRLLYGVAYPNVAADPIMYCPSVLNIPLGPGPKRTMFVNPSAVRPGSHSMLGYAPKMKPMIKPTADRLLDRNMLAFSHRYIHPPIIPPIFTACC
jgi:hypothetical protein